MEEHNKRKRKRIIILVIIILTIILIPIFLYFQDLSEENKGYTAMEAKEIADEFAYNWSKNATLIYVMAFHDDMQNGYSESWGFRYWSGKSDNDDVLTIDVYSSGKITTSNSVLYPHEYPIDNWNIDSPEAYKIAKNNDEIEKFLSKYKGATFDGLMIANHNNSTSPSYRLDWSSFGPTGYPHSASIHIDATNGNVEEVDVQM